MDQNRVFEVLVSELKETKNDIKELRSDFKKINHELSELKSCLSYLKGKLDAETRFMRYIIAPLLAIIGALVGVRIVFP